MFVLSLCKCNYVLPRLHVHTLDTFFLLIIFTNRLCLGVLQAIAKVHLHVLHYAGGAKTVCREKLEKKQTKKT